MLWRLVSEAWLPSVKKTPIFRWVFFALEASKPGSVIMTIICLCLKSSVLGKATSNEPFVSCSGEDCLFSLVSCHILSDKIDIVSVTLTGGYPLRLTPDTLPYAAWTFLYRPYGLQRSSFLQSKRILPEMELFFNLWKINILLVKPDR